VKFRTGFKGLPLQEPQREKVSVCVREREIECVCVCVRERESVCVYLCRPEEEETLSDHDTVDLLI
jgi:hypothetical protein